jgi:hypothetical protein
MIEIGNLLSKIITIILVVGAMILIFNRYDATHNQKIGTTTSVASKLVFKGIPKVVGELVKDKNIHKEIKDGFDVIKSDIKESAAGDYSDIDSTMANINTEVAENDNQSNSKFVSVETATEEELNEFGYIPK